MVKSSTAHVDEGESDTETHIINTRQQLHPAVYGRPVEEVDPFVFESTFCILAKKYRTNYVFRFSASKSLFLFGPLNPIRRVALKIMCHQAFDIFIILVIICNCVTLALASNKEIGTTGVMYVDEELNAITNIMEYCYFAIYLFELIVKVIAKGFVLNKFSYLRNKWNILDFLVIVFAIVGMLTSVISGDSETSQTGENIDFLRTFRVLRAIKTISILPGLRTMINALLSSVKQLVEVMVLTVFCLAIFALIALELFKGKLRQKCVLVKNGSAHLKMIYDDGSRDVSELNPITAGNPETNRHWYEWVNDKRNWLMRKDGYPKDEYVPCGNGSWARRCLDGFVCLGNIGENFDNGWTNFDTFWFSMLSTFQLLTLDFWERLYDLVLSSTSPFSVIFFLVVIFLGAFYLLNLMLAVVAMSYQDVVQESALDPVSKHQKLSLHRSSSTFSFDDPRRLNITVMTQYRKRTPEERQKIAMTLRQANQIPPEPSKEVDNKQRPTLHTAIMTLLGRRISMENPTHAKEHEHEHEHEQIHDHEHLHDPVPYSPLVHTPQGGIDPDIVPAHTINISPPKSAKNVHVTESQAVSEIRKSIGQLTKITEPKTSFTKTGRYTRKVKPRCWESNRVKRCLTPIVSHWAFEAIITAAIIVNTILMASEHHDQPIWLDELLQKGNLFFTFVFSIEAILKITAMQLDYFRSTWNTFDLMIILMSFADMIIEAYIKTNVIRALRLLRVFKLAQSWITMKVLLNIIVSTFGALGNLILVLLLVLYIFAVLGLQVIGEYYKRAAFEAVDNDEAFPRWNFEDFGAAFMLVFRVICGEWIEPLWDCLEATESEGPGGMAKCFALFLPILIIGNFIVLNLFLALLLNSFDTNELDAQREKELEASGKSDNLKKIVGMLMNKSKSQEKTTTTGRTSVVTQNKNSVAHIVGGGDAATRKKGYAKERFKAKAQSIIRMKRKEVAEQMIEKASLKQRQANATAKMLFHKPNLVQRRSSFGLGHSDSASITEPIVEKKTPEPCFPRKIYNLNCSCFNCMRRCRCTRWDKCRACFARVVGHPVFEWFILGLIFCSSMTLGFEDVNLPDRIDLQHALLWLNTAFTIIFVIEMLLKWFTLGLWTYFTNSWTILDFAIVVISVITLYYDVDTFLYLDTQGGSATTKAKSRITKHLAALKALRTLRALRPLRVISRWQGMKIVINALMYAIPSIFNVLLVCLLFWLIFAIMGVQFFKGKFYHCVDNDSGDLLSDEEVKTMEECCNNTNQWSWVNTRPNFDNVFQGYLTLFQVATFEGWMEAMQASIDSTDINKQPRRGNQRLYYLFYVVFIVFGAFFTLNLFIGVIIDNFNKLKNKYEGNALEVLLTDSQRNYYTAMKKLGRKKPRKVIKRPTNNFLSLFYDISMSRRFEIAIFIAIFLNMVIMAFEHHNQRDIFDQVLGGFNSFFTTIYALEAIVKIIGLRQYYFTVPWNLFDFILVVASIGDLFVDFDEYLNIPPQMLRMVRVFRIGRVLRLVKAAKGIRKLLFALVVSLPALFNIGALLALITFIYSILGMALFGRISKNNAIDELFNFDTFVNSFIILIRVMTAAGWNDILSAMTDEIPVCGTYRKINCDNDDPNALCADLGVAIGYLVSYLFISYLIVINMYIAIILENFVEADKEEETGIVEDDLEMFYVRWSRYDPQATQFISFDHLSEFLASLDPPLGIPRPNIVAIVAFNLPIARGNKIHCLDILQALVKHALGHIEDTEEFRKLQTSMEHKFRKQFPTRKLLDVISTTRIWKIQHNAAVIIQRAWRAYRLRKYPPLEKTRSASNLRGHQSSHHGMLNKMGTLLHLGHHDGKKAKLLPHLHTQPQPPTHQDEQQ